MANLWKTFETLLPKRRYYIGTVTFINEGLKLSTVSLLSGQSLTVKGTSVGVGQKCLIQDGIIIQEVPTLDAFNVTIY